jgi:hypothetical protein
VINFSWFLIETNLKFSRFNENVGPACLFNPNIKVENTLIESAGYGSIYFGDKRSDKLLKIGLNLVEKDECNKHFKADESLKDGINEGQICAKGWETDKGESDTCRFV